MTDLPRYRMVIDFGLEGFGDCVAPLLEADGDYVKWADISSRLQQLEQEKATLQKENSRKEAIRQCLDQDIHLLVGEKKLLVAALAETRAALQQKWEPIHTAPADAHVNPVLLFWPYWSQEPVMGHHVNGEWWTDKWLGEDKEDPGPTHWMRLPDPPSGA